MKYMLLTLLVVLSAAFLAASPARAQGQSCPYLEDVEINQNGECAGFVADGPAGAQQCAAIGGRLGPQLGSAGYAVPCFYRPVSAAPPPKPQPAYQASEPRPPAPQRSSPPLPTPQPASTVTPPRSSSAPTAQHRGPTDVDRLTSDLGGIHNSRYRNQPDLAASDCLSVHWQASRGSFALHNTCDYQVRLDFCVVAPGTLFPCGNAETPGAHGAGLVDAGDDFLLGYIATKRGQRLIQWMGCKQDEKNAIPVLAEIEPPKGACLAWM